MNKQISGRRRLLRKQAATAVTDGDGVKIKRNVARISRINTISIHA